MLLTPTSARGLSPVRQRLPNGAVMLTKETHVTRAVTISASLQAGSGYDPADRLGVSGFLCRVLDRGTETRSAEEIAGELDDRGVSLAIGTTRHVFTVSCTCLSEDLDAILALVADVIRRPSLPAGEIEKRRAEIVTALRQDEDNPAIVATEALMPLLYGTSHPYGRRAKGTMESVSAIEREDLVAFHRARFTPDSLCLVVVGAVDAPALGEAVDREFGDWRGVLPGLLEPPSPPPPAARQRRVIPMMNKAQADIAYGFTAIRRADPAYYAHWIMNHVLGQHGLGGRLGDSIRERQGMAYYAFSSLDANVGEGPLVIRAGVSPANVDRAVGSIDEEVARMEHDGVTDEELAEAKRYLVGSIPRTLETNAGIAAFLQSVEQFDLGLDYDLRLPGLLAAVTREETGEAARRTLCVERASVAIAGPYADDLP
jgi:zinc protease